MSTMTSPYKHPQTGVYYFRMAVPKALVPLIGKTVFKTSLRTKNLREAKLLFGKHLEDAQNQLELAKLKLSEESNVELNVRDCSIIAERWYEHVKHEVDTSGDYNSFLTTTREPDGKIHEFGLSDTLPICGQEIETATEKQLQELTDGLKVFIIEQLDREGLVVSSSSDSFRRLTVAFYHYVHRIEALCRARHRRDFGFDPITNPISNNHLSVAPKAALSSRTKARPSVNSISALFKRYVESETLKGKDSKSLDEVTLQIERLIEIIGDLDVSQVKRSHIADYRDTLLKLPKSKANAVRSKPLDAQIEMVKAKGLPTIARTTVKNCLRKTSAVFGYAIELGWIDVNPHRGVPVATRERKTEVDDGKGYSTADVSLLFKADVFNNSQAPKPYGMACYWVPILCRYTGARVEEMVQLRKADIAMSEDGIHYINIRRGEDQSVKNNISLRHVPIHDHLVELGFLDYVKDSSEFLFPELKANKHGKRSPALGKWWSQQVKALGINTNQPFHSFRHTLRTQLRGLEVLDTVSDSITGHAPSNVGASYGSVELKTKKAAIDRLPCLTLDRLSFR
ncbi:TPA: tyrosine-type recombinase/integrase [Vibrio parahaemolyticus]|nr:tyrosine-type recombinase/integrase [Vibrio parahaemolyticus]HAS6967093.1 tyrosine-type recombinase/integrase [Vibrio parahaemolyticus]